MKLIGTNKEPLLPNTGSPEISDTGSEVIKITLGKPPVRHHPVSSSQVELGSYNKWDWVLSPARVIFRSRILLFLLYSLPIIFKKQF